MTDPTQVQAALERPHAALIAAKRRGLRRVYFSKGAPFGEISSYGWYAASSWDSYSGDSDVGGPWNDATVRELCEAGLMGVSVNSPTEAKLTRAGKAELKRAAHPQPQAPVKVGGKGS